MKREPPSARLEEGRVRSGPMASDETYGLTGCFLVQGPCGEKLALMAGDGEGWEHVSVSTKRRTPNWEEMCFVKNLFWDEEETAMQLHPPKSVYVNCHPYCLHLWRPIGRSIPLPPPILVGPKTE